MTGQLSHYNLIHHKYQLHYYLPINIILFTY